MTRKLIISTIGRNATPLFGKRYVINSKYWEGSNINATILAYLGAEVPLDDALISSVGFLADNTGHTILKRIYYIKC